MSAASRTIASYDRLKNSTNGNPRYRIRFTDGSSAQTQSDAAVSYDVANLREGDEIDATFVRDDAKGG